MLDFPPLSQLPSMMLFGKLVSYTLTLFMKNLRPFVCVYVCVRARTRARVWVYIYIYII